MASVNKGAIRYIPGFDGLRALAVLGVIFYHLNIPYTSGGFLGVTVFFVLSGFLITSLLKWEWEQTGRVDLKHFWIRRAKRLLPAMFLLLIVLNVVIPFLRPELLLGLRKDTIAALFYYSNWHYIYQNLSYFELFQTPSLLTHFWSLAIEEQFYLVWAVAILFLFKSIKRKKIIFIFILSGSIISALRMYFMYDPNLDPSRVYYGTDTRIYSLLIGASFALLSPRRKLSTIAGWILEILGILGILVFWMMVAFTNQYDSFVYQGGMLLLSMTTAFLLFSLAWRSAVIATWILEWKPLKWIGIRSYGIYLWYYPIILLMNNNINTNGINIVKIILEITLIFGIASISYTFIEKPIRQNKIPIHFKNSILPAIGIVLIVFFLNKVAVPLKNIGASTIVENSPINNSNNDKGYSIVGKGDPDDVFRPPIQYQNKVTNELPVKDNSDKGSENSNGVSDDQKVNSPNPVQNKDENTVPIKNTDKPSPSNMVEEKITAIGDSVLINPTPYLEKVFPAISIDAKVSRQMRDAMEIVKELKHKKRLGEMVIIELGTNGSFPDKTLTDLLELIGKERKVFLVNIRVPRPWESLVNKKLKEISTDYSNTMVVDWYSTSANHNEYFLNDGVHLKPAGAKAFAFMIEEAVLKVAENSSK
ncbi:acyltransferase family protein [Neobacillus sp. D3-1R]|uniref:acyltransferase family protein n=1 Tax=Neobacillus sp. D3-1R TaxID=3445778 RepID=UPI003F9FE62B